MEPYTEVLDKVVVARQQRTTTTTKCSKPGNQTGFPTNTNSNYYVDNCKISGFVKQVKVDFYCIICYAPVHR